MNTLNFPEPPSLADYQDLELSMYRCFKYTEATDFENDLQGITKTIIFVPQTERAFYLWRIPLAPISLGCYRQMCTVQLAL